MMHRTPQRSYSPASLEAWFDRLSNGWEEWFSREELKWGRRFYREAEVRSAELMEDSAIVTFRRGKEGLYVIVDWVDGRPQFRQSDPDIGVGRGLGVTGLYELEEFVAEEVPAIEEEAGEEEKQEETGETGPVQPMPETERVGRTLCLRAEASTDGLVLRAGWADDDTVDWGQFALRQLTRWEREQLIGFTALAHRWYFRAGENQGQYRLREPGPLAAFLKKGLAALRAGFAVEEDPQLAQWRDGLREVRPWIRAEARANNASRFRMEFSSGESMLPPEVRDRLWRHPGHVQFVPGHGIYRIRPEAHDELQEWKSLLRSGGEGELPRYLLFTLGLEGGIQLDAHEELKRWREEVQAGAAASAETEMPAFLRGYQAEGVRWLQTLQRSGCHPLLADEMGLGKTVQVLAFLDSRQVLGREPVLVVCPASVVPVWQAEVERFYPQTEVRVVNRDDPFASKGPYLWLASYSQLRRNKQRLAELSFAYAILDEAQNIKNPEAKVTQACLAISSKVRIALTGTPMENRLLDLWTLFRFLMPGFLGSRSAFERAVKGDEHFREQLRHQVRPFILRRCKDEVARELPPKMEICLRCPLTAQQRRQYERLVAGAREEFKGSPAALASGQRMHFFSLLTRLRQVCCDPALIQRKGAEDWRHSGKLVSLVQHLEEAFASNSKVVIFSQFVQFLRRARRAVQESFPAVRSFELTGSTLDRDRPVRRFRQSRGPGVFFVSLRAGGTGLNLQAADYVFLLDPWWNPAVEAQAVDRVHRIGQANRVLVYRLVTPGTIEDRIERLKRDKAELFRHLLSDLDAPGDWLEQFKDLEEFIALEGATR